jgi:hypothetical protein
MKKINITPDEERIKKIQDILMKKEDAETPEHEMSENEDEQDTESENDIEKPIKPSLFKKHGLNIIISLGGKKG